ncbi:MAG: tetratricopeptide repeat protein [Alphaproteobacteria bacterium]|nr:tetratricopeptide repeat protein [Alphaproteobacteria bacterium]MBL7099532.1 tetratricopeptide repeat protein [Alphaproteobacteria bacterium]
MSGSPRSQNAALFTQVVGLINRGSLGGAEQMLTQVLGRMPNDLDGLQLLGLVRAKQGRTQEAETLYRRSLALDPKQPHVNINLGTLLTATGRAAEAIPLLRPLVRAQPNNADALVALGQAQQVAGETDFAERHLRAAWKLRPDDAAIALNLGSLCNEAGRPEDGEAVLRTALARPASPQMRAALEHNLGVALKLQGRWEEALAAFDDALKLAPDLPFADANRAGVLAHLKREDEAVAGYRRALAKNPLHMAAHQELNALLYRGGRDDEFLASFDDAERKLGPSPALWMGKAAFLNRTERFDEARALFEQAAKTQPENPEPLNGLALALAGAGRLNEAVGAYERSLRLRPEDVPTRVNLAGVLLRLGEGAKALTLTEAASATAPLDQAALAMHELALRINRDPRADMLANYDRHVQVFELDLPGGFNAELNGWLDALHGDAREHVDQTLRHGTQTMEPLFNSRHGLIAALQAKIDDAVTAYIARMDDDGEHPLSSRRSKGFRFTGSWSSRLHDQGFHTNHIHPKGWISSVYYVAVPDSVEDGQQGWLKFGEPSFATPMNDAIRRVVKPAPARLVLFPSYMWHGTVPFRSQAARTTIAFDAVPA